MSKFIFLLMLILSWLLGHHSVLAQSNQYQDMRDVLRSVQSTADDRMSFYENVLPELWWDHYVTQPLLPDKEPRPVQINQLLVLAMQNSFQLDIQRHEPLLREAQLAEANAAFDWTLYADQMWRDISDPVGNQLTTGNGIINRFNDHQLSVTGGVRRRTTTGATIDFSQRVGHQSNNSRFFDPNNQGTALMSLRFNQPLWRGKGRVVNTGAQVVARMNSELSNQRFIEQLQTHLLQITNVYWSLYLERGALSQKIKLYLVSQQIVERIVARRDLDASELQLATALSALENRKADLLRAQATIQNLETQLRQLVNAPDFKGGSNFPLEIIPKELPDTNYYLPVVEEEMERAVQKRPEISQALKRIMLLGVRYDLSKNDLLPTLDLVTETYVQGLQGDSEIGQAWVSQFSDGAPSYTIGLNMEIPIGNRAANARVQQQQIELSKAQKEYQFVLEQVSNQIEVAVREVRITYENILAKQSALEAAEKEVDAFTERWQRDLNQARNWTLTLESLLQSQERLQDREFQLLKAVVDYNIALMNLKRANGTFVEMRSEENVDPPPTFRPESEFDSQPIGYDRAPIEDPTFRYMPRPEDLIKK